LSGENLFIMPGENASKGEIPTGECLKKTGQGAAAAMSLGEEPDGTG